VNPYLCSTDEERAEMLNVLGMKSEDELFLCIPEDLKKGVFPQLQTALGEFELSRKLETLARQNLSNDGAVCFMGGGAYEHFIPAVVPALAGRSEFVTSYTPYQPEASQGNLQVFFEFQTMTCRLFEMDVANASMCDGATSLAEGVLMAAAAQKGRNRCLISETLHPHWRETLETYLKNLDLDIVVIKSINGMTDAVALERELDERAACVVAQNPNFLGCIEDMQSLSDKTHSAGAAFIVAADPLSLGLLAAPGEYGADVAAAEGQCLGLPPYFGGETLGIFTCKKDFMRKMPGRLVGLTKDLQGRRGFVLTLQTREQHIRRDKATSNICSDHALNATKAAIYMAALGPAGIREIGETCRANIQYLQTQLADSAISPLFPEAHHFKEIAVRFGGDVNGLIDAMNRKGFLIGPSLEKYNSDWKGAFLLSATEVRTRDEMDRLVAALRECSR